MTHSFDVDCACKYGLVESIILHHMRFWIQHNKANNVNHHDGRTWTYNTTTAFQTIFPYLTPKKLRCCLEKLQAEGILLKQNFNSNPYVHTSWYAFFDENAFLKDNVQNNVSSSSETQQNPFCPPGQIDLPPRAIRIAPQGKSKTDIIPDIITNTISRENKFSREEEGNSSKKILRKKEIAPAVAALDFEARKEKFHQEIAAFKNQHPKRYPSPVYKDFFEWWTEPNASKTKMRFEAQYFGIRNRLEKFWRTRTNLEKSAYWTEHYEQLEKKDNVFSMRNDPQIDLRFSPTTN